jgi:hypothetical protein
MPIRFIGGDYKSVIHERRETVRRLLHIAFDHGYLCEGNEIEAAWEKTGWEELSKDDDEVWATLEKCLETI